LRGVKGGSRPVDCHRHSGNATRLFGKARLELQAFLPVQRASSDIPSFSATMWPIWVVPERDSRKGMPIWAPLITISEVSRPVV
jgi:hypothetical protein